MSIRSLLAGAGGVKSIQTGLVNGAALTSTGEDIRYIDITVSAVTIAKCNIEMRGGVGVANAKAAMVINESGYQSYNVTARLTSTTNLRISSINTEASMVFYGRWTITEFN